jgi:hypothetical protein
MEGMTLGLQGMGSMSTNRILLLVAAAATAVIMAIYSSLISKWSGLNVVCLLAFGAILLSYALLFIRDVEIAMAA